MYCQLCSRSCSNCVTRGHVVCHYQLWSQLCINCGTRVLISTRCCCGWSGSSFVSGLLWSGSRFGGKLSSLGPLPRCGTIPLCFFRRVSDNLALGVVAFVWGGSSRSSTSLSSSFRRLLSGGFHVCCLDFGSGPMSSLLQKYADVLVGRPLRSGFCRTSVVLGFLRAFG